MDKKTEALKLALEALEIERNVPRLGPVPTKTSKAITALREALTSVPDWASEAKEQPAQQEPVAKDWRHVIPGRRHTDQWDSARVADYNQGWNDCQKKTKAELEKLYTSPQAQQEPWVGLTDEEIERCMKQAYATVQGRNLEHAFARAIEAKLREKNGIKGDA